MRPRILPALAAASAAVTLAACGGAEPAGSSQQPLAVGAKPPALEIAAAAFPDAVTPVSEPACEPGEHTRMRTERRAYGAVVKRRAIAYARPEGKRMKVFRRLNENEFPTVFGVLGAVLGDDCLPAWYRVQLPMKPNGSVGYVRARDVELVRVDSRIVVDLSARRLELFDRGRRVVRAKIAVGSPITPTPIGRYYVNQRLVAPDPWGPFGPGALGISAFSPVLQEWAQGGPIAIHGTNEPGSIGQAVSHGCIRIRNETLLLLFRMAPAGTPVVVRA